MRTLVLLLLLSPAFGENDARRALCRKHAVGVGDHLLGLMDRMLDPEAEPKLESDIYSGKAGVALFLVDLHKATKQKRFFEGAQRLLAQCTEFNESGKPGLYTGLAGIGHVYLNAGMLEKAEACAKKLGPPEATDIIYGAAGTGIFYLNLHVATGKKRWLTEADKLGKLLVKHAVRKDGHTHWPVTPNSDRVYIGFSHGAAGIGYYLLHLHLATKNALYRELAEEAARFVTACAVPDGDDGWKWTKMHPARKQDYRVQWCHGSPGNGLFYLDLYKHLGGKQYKQALDRCVASTRRSGRWAGLLGCQCHGSGGNAELFIEVYRHNKDRKLLDPAHLWSKDLSDEKGVHTKVRGWAYKPGYMKGMAGIGRFFLRLSDPENVELALMVNPPRSPSKGR